MQNFVQSKFKIMYEYIHVHVLRASKFEIRTFVDLSNKFNLHVRYIIV